MALYALLDWDTLKNYDISIKDFCKTAKGLKAKILQYRDKNSSVEEKFQRLLEIRKYWKKPLIINDTIELLPYADGIHIGQEDLEKLCNNFNLSKVNLINAIKNGEWRVESGEFKIIKNSQLSTLNSQFIIGLSTHNKEEILEANRLPLSYIGLGAYRQTSTKETSNILGEKVIELIKYSNHPVAVIGGVKIYDKIPSKFKVVGSDICKLTSIRLKKKKNLLKKSKSL
ncbi:thiamine phosphate synthase [Caminibacter sp.]